MNKEIGFIKKVNKLFDNLESIIKGVELFDLKVVETLDRLENQDLSVIIDDLKKSNYLGNRKIDIDLSLNNKSNNEMPTYSRVDIILVDGDKLEMPFDNGSGGVLEMSSHADIKNFITNNELWKQVENTEIVLYEAYANTPNMIRVRDADGKSSNIERLELTVYSGEVVNQKVSYFWAKTTSALETLSNRIGDIIQLGNDVGSIVSLSQKKDELVALHQSLNKLLVIYNNLSKLLLTEQNAEAVSQNKIVVEQKTQEVAENVLLSKVYLQNAKTAAETATAKATQIQSIKVEAQQLTTGQSPTVVYDSLLNKFVFGIPQGKTGEKGDAFKVNTIGFLSDKGAFDNEQGGFSYLATDVVITTDGVSSVVPHIFFKRSATTADWTVGIPFGRGEKGDVGREGRGIKSVIKTSGDGSSGTIDTYTITLTDDTTTEFKIYNGKDSDISSLDLNALKEELALLSQGNSTLINNHKNDKENPHAVTKGQIGLSNVDNTSDKEKPLSDLAVTEFAKKLNVTDTQNTLSSNETTKPLSAYQGKVLKGLIDNINTILQSDNTSLDTLQEIVDFIEINRTTLSSLQISSIAGLQTALNSKLSTTGKAASASAADTATTANKLSAARNIALTGAVTGSANFDGGGNINIVTTSPLNSIGDYALVCPVVIIGRPSTTYTYENVAGSNLQEISVLLNPTLSAEKTKTGLVGTWYIQGECSIQLNKVVSKFCLAKRIA
ncbi:hypothetical protein ACNSOO_04740 [Aliarcobacter lanthieri]|uniref:hypothetical protein n=1 Tax=Aliarcobacter lanthieri TaxID=1355374 RepID=UPI003AAE5B44